MIEFELISDMFSKIAAKENNCENSCQQFFLARKEIKDSKIEIKSLGQE